MKNSLLKKLTALALCLCMVLPVVSSGFAPLSALLDGIALQADAAVAGIKIVVPETIYLEPSITTSTKGQHYVNNKENGDVDVEYASTANVFVTYPGATLKSVNASNATISWSTALPTAMSSTASKGICSISLNSGLSAGQTTLVEWIFVFEVNGKTQTHYAYSVAYAPWYLPVGAAARAVGSHHNVYTSSILWVSGVHGYSDGGRANNYYVKTGKFLPMLGDLASPSNNDPDANWIQSDSNGLSSTVSYNSIGESGTNYHARANTISPTANLTVDISRYNNFKQIPNFTVGFMITNRTNINEKYRATVFSDWQYSTNEWYVSDYGTSNGSSYYNGTARGSSQYTSDWNDNGDKKIWSGTSDLSCGIKVNCQPWDKAISGTADFRLKSAATGMNKAVITSTSWNNNFVNISVTGVNKESLRSAVLAGSSYAKENYTEATWNAYYEQLKAAAGKLGNPVSTDVATSSLTTAESALEVKLTFDNLIDFSQWNTTSASNAQIFDVTDNGFTLTCNADAGEGTSSSPYFAVEPGQTYEISIDFTGTNWDVYIFFCDKDGTWIDFADGPTNRFSDSTTWGNTFTAPNKAEVVKAQIRVDANGANNTVRYENIRVYEAGSVTDNDSYIYPIIKNHNDKYGTLPTPVKEGHTFLGWYRADGTAVGATDTINPVLRELYSKWKVNPYTITFDTDGGSAVGSITQNYNTSVSAPADPTKTGYTFAGWYNGTEKVTFPVNMPVNGMDLKAKWTINQYTITFDTDGGSSIAPITQDYNTAITAPANPTKTGYTFAGWDKEIPANMPAENITIKAKWNINPYTIHFDSDGGSAVGSITQNYDTSVSAPADPTKTGYTFAGWYNGTEKVKFPVNMPEDGMALKAKWTINQYTITFDTDGGTAIPAITQDYNTAVTAPADPTKAGFVFVGWDTAIPAKMPAENITIKAKWKSSDASYTVTYYLQNADANGYTATETIAEIFTFSDTSLDIAALQKEFTGFTFDKVTDQNGTELGNELVLPTGKTEIQFYFTRNSYTVRFDSNGGTGTMADLTVPYGASVNLTANAFAKTGYSFTGWKCDGITYADEQAIESLTATNGEVLTFTAQWTINQYTITFDTDGGSTIAPITQDYNTAITAPSDPTKTGYTFVKWDKQIPSNMPAENITITAEWKINQYTITFDTDGGTVIAPITQDYNTAITAPANPTKTGYTFAGWYNGAEKVSFPIQMPADGMTVKAAWTINQYTITFDTDGGSTIAPIAQDYNTAITAPADPTKTGYTFVKWDKQIPSNMPAENITITAEWKINQYTITFDTDGGTEVAPITQDYDTTVDAPADPTKTGYTFAGWYNGTDKVTFPVNMPVNGMDLKAKWTINQYTISFDTLGGSEVPAISRDFGTAIEKPANPTKEGYDFICWLKDGEEYAIPDTMPAEDFTLTAKWQVKTYTITFDSNGGSDVAPITQEFATIVKRPANPTKQGYTFTGWNRPIPSTMPAENITITAIWTANDNTPYKVEHYQQDIGADTYTLFETQTLKGVTDTDVTPVFKNYAGFTSKGDTVTANVAPDGSLVIRYYYTRNTYTVTFDTNGGDPVDAKTFAYGETITLTEEPVYVGYIFTGWNPALPKTMPASNLRVTASWIPNPDTPYTVYHHYQDLDCISYPDDLTEKEVCYGETGSIVEVELREKFGFTAPEKRSIVIAADGTRTVRYYYTRNSYSVTFIDYDDKILSLQNVVFETAATPPALAGRDAIADGHYVFTDWSSDPTCIKGNTTCKAQYELIAHTGNHVTDCTTQQVCTVCGYVMKEANGHTPVVTRPAVAPTCTEPGSTADSYCELCGIVLSTYQVVPATGHKVGSWYVDVPATATSTGVLKRNCTGCDLFETHEIPVLSDKPVTSVAITTQGSQAYIGTSYQLKTSIQPADAPNQQVLWESSDPSVATVSADGYITSRKPGEVTFTALTLDGLKTDSITVNFFYSSSTYSIVVLDLFGCELYLDGKNLNQSAANVVNVKAGSTLAFTLKPTTTEYLEQGGYILTANGSNIKPDANGVYYIYNVYENIEITALPVIGKPEFDDNQHYDSDEVPKKSIFAKLLEFFERIMAWFRGLFQ